MYDAVSKEMDEWAECYDLENKEVIAIRNEYDFTGKDVLEVGCGSGRFSFRLHGVVNKLVGIDTSKQSIQIAKSKASNYREGDRFDFYNCDFLGNDDFLGNMKFDCVLFSWSLHCLGSDYNGNYENGYRNDDIELGIEKAVNYLKTDGHIVIIQPYYGDFEKVFDAESYDFSKVFIMECEACKKYFCNVITNDLYVSFTFHDEDDAIAKSDWIYKAADLSNSMFMDKDLLNDKRQILKGYMDGSVVKLPDRAKLIFCSKLKENVISALSNGRNLDSL